MPLSSRYVLCNAEKSDDVLRKVFKAKAHVQVKSKKKKKLNFNNIFCWYWLVNAICPVDASVDTE